ncbi:MAG TPA: site-2 protease family protein [Candidatus Saccharimonadales bacterium]|nr:site-2 protease family protein [Candidatus Saccharimonadales bacterium]
MFSGLSGFELVVVLVSIIISMAIHEATHGFVAHWLGDPTALEEGRLTLNPLKHVDVVTTVLLPMVLIIVGLPPIFAAKPVPFNPDNLRWGEFGMALVGVAGPLTNLILAALAALVFQGFGASLGQDFYNALIIFVQVNIAFFVFNMIPFPPLDGSRLLYAFAPEPLQDIMRQIESFGFLGILVFILLIFQFISGPLLGIENFFIQLLLG